jgi:hypothetical protein
VIVVDTGPLVAAVLSNDADHRACVDLFASIHPSREQMVVSRRHLSVVRPRHVDAFTLLP